MSDEKTKVSEDEELLEEELIEEEDGDEEEDLESQVLALLQSIQRKNGRTLVGASKRKKKKLYNDVKVVGKNFDSEAKTDGDLLADEFRTLTAAMNSTPKTILTGTVIGVEEMEALKTAVAVVKLDNTAGYYRILIPASRMMMYDAARPQDQENAVHTLGYRIGQPIKFHVIRVDEANATAFCSRLDAMQMESGKTYKKQRGEAPLIVEGSICEGTITSVRKGGCYIEVGGAETYVPKMEMSWNFVTACTDEFKIGQKINVKIKKIQAVKYATADGTSYNLFNIEASAREARNNPVKYFYNHFNIGQQYQAVVTDMNVENKTVFVSLGPGKMDAAVFIPNFFTPARGDRVIVQITEKVDAEHRIYGRIVRQM